MRNFLAAILICCVILPASALAADYYVNAATTEGNVVGTGTSEATAWQTITYAMTQVSANDTVRVASGEYTASMSGSSESFPISIPNSVALISTYTYLATIEELGSATTVINMTTDTTLEGFYIEGDGDNRVIYVGGSRAVIKNNKISAEGYNYGISFNAANDPTHVLIESNVIWMVVPKVSVSYVGIQFTTGTPSDGHRVYKNEIRGFGYGIYAWTGTPAGTYTIERNTIVKNCRGVGLNNAGGTANVKNNIISNVPSLEGDYAADSYGISRSGGTVNATYNNLWKNDTDYTGTFNTFTNNISRHPGFVSPEADDYRLHASDAYYTNPCIGTGDGGVNMGCYDGSVEAGVPYIDESYVSGSGNDTTGDGTSGGTAWRTLTKANRYTVSMINVATGEYSVANGETSFPINFSIDRYVKGVDRNTVTVEAGAADVIYLDRNSSLEGFTLMGGEGTSAQVILINGGSVIIKDNLISAEGYNYGISFNAANDPTHVSIESNVIWMVVPKVSVSYVGIRFTTGTPSDGHRVYKNEIRGFYYGISAWTGTPAGTYTIERNTIVKNRSGISLNNAGGTANVKNNIVSNVPSLEGDYAADSYGVSRGGGTVNATYNNLWKNETDYTGTFDTFSNNISRHPGFVSAEADDYRLHASDAYYTNPCIGTGDGGVNMGCYDGSVEAGVPYIDESYVSGSGNDTTGDGTSEGTAWRTLTKANRYTVSMINVGTGEYSAANGETSFPINFSIDRYVKGVDRNTVTVEAGAADVIHIDRNSSLEGFTLMGSGGTGDQMILINGKSVIIKDNLISAEGYGSGIELNPARDTYDITIESNVIWRETLTTNTSYVGIYFPIGTPSQGHNIYKNEIRGFGYGIYTWCSDTPSGTCTIDRNTIVKNQIGVSLTSGTRVVKNNIIAAEVGEKDASSTKGVSGSGIIASYNDVYANDTNWSGVSAGTGAVTADAQFIDATGNDFHLAYNSPCIDSGDPSSSTDPDTSRRDIGAYPFDLTVPGTIAVYVKDPDGGESWIGYSIEAITWYATEEIGHLIDHVEIAYSTDEGATYTIIETNEANDGSYDWTVANKPTTEALVRISAFGSAATDESDSKFTILDGDTTPPSVEVISPNGNEKWPGGSQHNISFTVTDANPLEPNSVNLYYTSGEGWVAIDTGQPTDSAYAWTLPLIDTTEARVKVSVEDESTNLGSDESNSFFTIDSTSPGATSIVLSDRTSGSTLESNSVMVSVEALGVSADPYLMRLAENSGFTTNSTGWISYVNPTTFTFAWGNGTREVYYQLRDEASNESPVLNDSIVVNVSIYYVDAVTGSDADTGSSEGEAWKTITYALGTTESGDIILCSSGTYDATNGETFPLNIDDAKLVSGEATLECFIIGSGSPPVIISGGAEIKNFTIINNSGNNDEAIIQSTGASTIRNNTLYWVGTAPSGSMAIEFAAGSSGSALNNTIYNTGTGIKAVTSNTLLISNNTLTKYDSDGIYASAGTFTIKNNILSSSPLLDSKAVDGSTGINNSGATLLNDYNNLWGNDTNLKDIDQGTNSVNDFAYFVDPTNNDYKIYESTVYASSPLLDAGEGGENIGAYDGNGETGSVYRDSAYVDPNTGADSTSKGFDTGTEAYKTLEFANQYAVNVMNAADGTYDLAGNTLTLSEGKALLGSDKDTVNIQGTAEKIIELASATEVKKVSIISNSSSPAATVIDVDGNNTTVDDAKLTFSGAAPTNSSLVKVNDGTENSTIQNSTLQGAEYGILANAPATSSANTIVEYEKTGFYADHTGEESKITNTILVQQPDPNQTADPNTYGVYAKNGDVELLYDGFFNNATNIASDTGGTVTEGVGLVIDKDPKFYDVDANDFRLKSDSPYIGSGENGEGIGAWSPDYSGDFIACHITTPDGGETLGIGNAYAITWYASKGVVPIDKIDLYYSTDSGATFAETIATDLTNTGGTNSAQTGMYAWTVPDAPTSSARVRVIATVGTGSAQDDSDTDFTIAHTGENIPPNINVRVGGFTIISDDYIDRDTTFDIYFTDNLELDDSSVVIELDDTSVAYTTVYDLGASMHVQHRAASLSEGTHDLTVSVRDTSGNAATKDVNDLQVVYGAARIIGPVLVHPTPFAPKSGSPAKFAYHLNKDVATTIYVYSPSRLEWTRKYAAGQNGGKAGYNEPVFSAISDVGQAYFGNGIYVLRVVAEGHGIGKSHVVIYD